MTENGEIDRLLAALGKGDPEAWQRLLPPLYDVLHEIAHRTMRRQKHQGLLQTTAVVHEAFLRLAGSSPRPETRRHFERIAARAMRAVVVDHARAQLTQKRGIGWGRVLLTEDVSAVAGPGVDMLALDEALERLHGLDPLGSEVAELRCFARLEHEAIAQITGRSTRTIARLWRVRLPVASRGSEGAQPA